MDDGQGRGPARSSARGIGLQKAVSSARACGARCRFQPDAMLLRPFRALTLVLAIGGLLALIWAARATPRAITSAGAITPAMNFAYVRLSGAVIDFPAVEPDGSYLSFRVADADGVVRAQAYRAVASTLLAANAIPSPGDEAQIEGTLRIRDGEAALLVNSADGIVLTRRTADVIGLSGLDGLTLGQRAAVLGQIRRVRGLSRY